MSDRSDFLFFDKFRAPKGFFGLKRLFISYLSGARNGARFEKWRAVLCAIGWWLKC